MTPRQWELLQAVLRGERLDPPPVGFLVDSPWLPGWAGGSILDYYASETFWLETNLRAVREFPDVLFLPGFWSEFGMCSEPSAFGARPVWAEDDLPCCPHQKVSRRQLVNASKDGVWARDVLQRQVVIQRV